MRRAQTQNPSRSCKRRLKKVLKEGKVPGAAVVMVSRDKPDWVACLGKADVAANTPVTADTLFRLGSVSKGFVALAALQLQEAGKLKLTDTVRQWAPDVAFVNPWEASDPVRLVHLMEHTTGFEEMHLREFALNDPTPIAVKDALAYGASSRVCRWPPGTRMAYCNSGPAVLAAVVEKVSGERFEDYVREHLFKPLHMDGAGYFYTPEVQQKLAKLYHADGITPYPYWHIDYRPTAAISAPVRDMANYLRFYLQRGSLDDTQLLQAASIERMETADSMPSAKLGPMLNYGLYNYDIPDGAFVFHGHNGAVMGDMTQMAYLPEQGRGYVLMLNSGNFYAAFQIGKLLRQYLTRDLTPPPLPPVASVPADLQQHYTGYYEPISPSFQCFNGFERLVFVHHLTFNTNELSTSIYGFARQKWVPMSERLFRTPEESIAEVALLPDADGNVLIQAGFATYRKIPALEFWAQSVAAVVVSVLVVSSFICAPIWIFRKLRRKHYIMGPLAIRVLPLASAALLVMFELLIVYGFRGILTGKYVDDVSLGEPTFLTVSIMLCSGAFPVVALAGLWVAYRERNTPMNRMSYWHAVLIGVAVTGTAIYYGYWGLVGLRLWA